MAVIDDDSLWINELENALLEGCSVSDIYCICKGKPLPENLRSDVWQICLDVRDKGNQLDHFDEVYDLPNQNILREDCKNFVSNLGNDEEDKIQVISDLESIITFYCKSRNMSYSRHNGWIEILLPILTLKVPKSTTYNLFEAIRDTFIPQSCEKNGNAFHILRLLLLYHDPELCSFLDTKRITPEHYCLAWFQSLFAATCSLQVVINMWDYYFQQSDPFFVFFLSLIMVVNARDQIISMKSDDRDSIIASLSNMPCGLEAEDVADFCSLAQYYALKTPMSFRNDLLQTIYNDRNEAVASVSQALCLPVSVHELVENIAKDSTSVDAVRFFLVDCRPIEHFNAGHLPTAFHLDCTLMLQEPSAFATAVQGLLSAQKQAIAHNSTAGKLSAAMRLKSAEVTGKLIEYIVNPTNSPVPERHVSSSDRIGRRYRDVAPVFSIDDDHDNVASFETQSLEDIDSHEIVNIQSCLKKPDVIQHFPCQEVRMNGSMFKSHLIITDTELIVLREVPEPRGSAELIVKRPLSAIVKITARKRHPELITFKYGVPDGENLKISDMDRFLIPNADTATKVVSDQILKQLKAKE
ncbi:hypothetical protein HUJ05_001120 [Dendroctonus ponderosae]|nr:hypothetical protein HUJ05_001120 [Dendroctonus ponderosae]